MWAYREPRPALIACEVMFVEQRFGGLQCLSAWFGAACAAQAVQQ